MESVSHISGNTAESPAAPEQAELLLPGYIERRADGVWVDPDKLPSPQEFQRLVERVFAGGHYFAGLNYTAFQRFLYDFDKARSSGPCRLAGAVQKFPEARRSLYKAVKVGKGEVEYIFEPLIMDGDDGAAATGEKARLDVDEFVADMWAKGVRFGIDIDRVRAAIADERCERMVVARERQPQPGQDAGIEEQSAELHRDDAPRELANGRVDLRQFKNRFPQIKAGTVLLKKVPRRLGEVGYTVDGRILAPPLPKDFDLASLAGAGTRIESRNGNEYIVAAMDGFLDLDAQTNSISVAEKIVHREGVSARTTGNLSLAGDHYEEYGEVQEGRVVEGKSLVFHADVFGKVLSSGGDISLEQNLVGGTALNQSGGIFVLGLASNALVQTASGTVTLKRAENSVLIGDRVEVEWASNCTILAEEVEIAAAEGCAIAGKRIHLGMGRARSGEETLVSMLLPDLSGIVRAEEKERKHLEECEELAARLKRGIAQLLEQAEVRQYLGIAGKLQRKEIALSAEQQGQWQQFQTRVAPTLKRIAQGREDVKALEGEIAAAQERLAALQVEKEKAGAELACGIDSILGEVVVRPLLLPADAPPLSGLSPRELKLRLRAPNRDGRPLFSGSSGSFAWKP